MPLSVIFVLLFMELCNEVSWVNGYWLEQSTVVPFATHSPFLFFFLPFLKLFIFYFSFLMQMSAVEVPLKSQFGPNDLEEELQANAKLL